MDPTQTESVDRLRPGRKKGEGPAELIAPFALSYPAPAEAAAAIRELLVQMEYVERVLKESPAIKKRGRVVRLLRQAAQRLDIGRNVLLGRYERVRQVRPWQGVRK